MHGELRHLLECQTTSHAPVCARLLLQSTQSHAAPARDGACRQQSLAPRRRASRSCLAVPGGWRRASGSGHAHAKMPKPPWPAHRPPPGLAKHVSMPDSAAARSRRSAPVSRAGAVAGAGAAIAAPRCQAPGAPAGRHAGSPAGRLGDGGARRSGGGRGADQAPLNTLGSPHRAAAVASREVAGVGEQAGGAGGGRSTCCYSLLHETRAPPLNLPAAPP